jgi:hypothetical protein
MNRKLLLAFIVVVTAASIAACGGSSSNPTEIAFNTQPPADLQAGQSVQLAATVFNNSNTGVDWSVSCNSSSCGSFNPTSGPSTTYTAPSTVPSGNTVTITATSDAKQSVSVMATVTITTGTTGSALSGQYVFAASGIDASLVSYFAVGSITTDGNGNITGGEEDFCDDSAGCSSLLLSGTYSTGSDGRGAINISSTSSSSSVSAQSFDIVVTSSSHALIVEFDGVATGSGTLDLQDSSALTGSAITGNYAFAVTGLDGNGAPTALGGVLAASGDGGFSSGGNIAVNDGGTVESDSTPLAVVSGPDSFGRTVVESTSGSFPLEFVYYTVNAKALRMVEVDLSSFLTGGSAYSQGSATSANLAGSSVFTEAGTSAKGSLGLAGQLESVSSGLSAASGFMDVNDNFKIETGSIAGSTFGSFSGASGALTLSGSVSGDVTQFDVFLVDTSVNILDPTNATGGGGALLLDTDTNAVGIGELIPQTSGASFSGNYGANLQAFTSAAEIDLEAQVIASGTSFSGTADLNDLDFNNGEFAPVPAQSLSGSFSADSGNPGRYTGSLAIGSQGTLNFTFYQATNSQLVLVEVDTTQIGAGDLVAQQ